MQACTITFTSDRFAPFLPDEAQVNTGVYGFELALWLSQALVRQSVVTSYPNDNDWCWYLDFLPGGRQEFEVCCCNDGDGGLPPRDWKILIRQHRKPRKDEPDATEGIKVAILSALAAEGIEARQT